MYRIFIVEDDETIAKNGIMKSGQKRCRLLVLLNLSNTGLFVKCLVITLLVFMLIYYLVFCLTSRAYYRIVGNQVNK